MAEATARVKVGVVGVGSLGQHHARIYAQMPEAELVGVYDSDAARAKAIADTHETRAFATLDELAGSIEAASIAVPTDRHREVAGVLLERGIHLLVEKPIAATTAEAEALVSLAQKHNCILQVGHVERFNPVMSFLEGVAKRPRFIEAHRLAPYPPPREGLHPRGTEVSVVLDLMIHDLEVILHLVGKPVREIRAVGVPVLSPSEDIANVRLAFEDGCVANVTASRISPERMRKIRVFLDDAYISLDYQNQAGEMFRKTAGGITREQVPIEKGEPLANELRAFVQCVARRGEPVVSGQHAADALKLAVRIIQSLKEGPS
ncbi:MAG: Gfo/Idh/MocA family oxidoreductase [Kiritimatiellae bacterium]|nr:Gfo/Idh/MocA family oxidoreductase [Kiritimatiellia bacterium]